MAIARIQSSEFCQCKDTVKRPYHHGALRETLLAAAETILERDGVEALTLRGAAREAGVTHGSPAHHFGDLSGLLSDLAAIGFVRFHARLQAETAAAGQDPNTRMIGRCRGYVRFARDSPGLFQLMFRSGRLDWSRPALAAAGANAFALLMEQDAQAAPVDVSVAQLAAATAHWSLAHGLAMLLIDGRLRAVTQKASEPDVETLVDAVLAKGLLKLPC